MKLPINEIICGAMPEATKGFPDGSFDAIVTDIPYGIGFMGKEWDTFKQENVSQPKSYKLTYKTDYKDGIPVKRKKPEMVTRDSGARRAGSYDLSRNAEYQEWCRVWSKECLRIAKPGAFLLCFGGTRTYHRVTCGLEDAGWQIRDCLMWLYGSGFPKSHNIGKAIEKQKVGGIKNLKQIGTKKGIKVETGTQGFSYNKEYVAGKCMGGKQISGDIPVYEINNEWGGYGTALKPAWEPIIVAMKPVDGNFAKNAEKYGVAGLNIDGGRISHNEPIKKMKSQRGGNKIYGQAGRYEETTELKSEGRWPANLILDEEAAAMLDEQTGEVGNKWKKNYGEVDYKGRQYGGGSFGGGGYFGNSTYADSGGASRFFYCAKASRAERNAGLAGMPEKRPDDRTDVAKGIWTEKGTAKQTNHHPTVKPLKLMEYLCTLLKPPSEHPILLDPFCGSGTTLMAAFNTGWDYIGIDKEAEYVEIANKRVAWCKGQQPLFPVEKQNE